MSNRTPARGTAYDPYRAGDGLWRPPRTEGLARVLAKAGYGARPQAEEIVRSGRVRVDGVEITEPGHPVEPTSQVALDGAPLREAPRRYLMLHKPPGFECQGRGGPRWIGRLFPSDTVGLEPAGRLDTRGSGLVLLSNDQRWNTFVAGSERLERRYEIAVSGVVTDMMLDVIRGGITLPTQGVFRPERVEVLDEQGGLVRLRIAVQGQHARKIRAAFTSLRCEVGAMVLAGLGPLSLGDLRRGRVRDLSPSEYAQLAPPDQRGSPS